MRQTLGDVGSPANRSCIDFSANVVGTNTTADDVYSTNFTCEGDGAYLSRIDIKWGWWIDTLKVAGSDGSESAWFGNENYYEGEQSVGTFGGGLKNLSAYAMDVVGFPVPAVVILYGFDKDEGYPGGMVLGPYGRVIKPATPFVIGRRLRQKRRLILNSCDSTSRGP